MSAVAFSLPGSRLYTTLPVPYTFPQATMAHEAMLSDRRMSSVNEGLFAPTTLLLRRLPRTTTAEAVRTMLLFAKDLQDTEIIPNEYEEDKGFATAIARFASMIGASEAQMMLDGKPNTAGQASMVVEIVSMPALGLAGRRNTIDPSTTRGIARAMSPPASHVQKSSRFNGTFQSIEKLSPPSMASPPDHSSSESNSHLQNIFAPHSPVANTIQDRSRISGKSVIGEDGGDEETDGLLKDPLAYIKNDNSGLPPSARKPNNARVPIAGFNALTLNTSMNSPSPGGYTSPRSAMAAHTPHTAFSPGGGSYQVGGNQYLRHNYPPVNPADQNPPCNTLYVGNLPIDTSEDELKAMFSKQRGYKRLCFRTKQNGPMCFVEFEDVSFATKALNELYGAQLHNSVKGGIRLSFSKNPLGVRSGPGGTNPSTPLTTTGPAMLNGLGAMSPGAFSSANGPPPGLSVPPGFSSANPGGSSLMNGQYANQGHSVGGGPMPGLRALQMNGTSGAPSMNGMYPDYMMGR